MRQVRMILEYRFERHLSIERIGQALGVAKGTVVNTLNRFSASGMSWPLPESITNTELEDALYPKPDVADAEINATLSLPDVNWLENELRRPHVTLQRLWEEYYESHPDGLSRSAFYRYWNRHRKPDVEMKLLHRGGEKLFVDYSGDGPSYIDKLTGELIEVRLFVICWGASSYTYIEATHSECEDDFVASHVRAFDYFGVCGEALVPDNLKSGVKKPSRYEPDINRLYEDMASHYGMVVLPARVRKPQDKATVENAVLQAQRFILALLRDRQFFSLAEINEAIREELELLNSRPMKDYGNQSRKERFELLDKPYAKALPSESFKVTRIKSNARVAPNYHIRYEDHFYSVPYNLVGKHVDVYQTGNIIEIYHDNVHVFRHAMGPKNFQYTTVPEHMPPNHKFVHGGWTPDYFLSRASGMAPEVGIVIESIFKQKKHPQQAFNAAMGLLQLAKAYTPERLGNACKRALHHKSPFYKSIKSILEQGLDKQVELNIPEVPSIPEEHENIRGTMYYAV